MKVWAWIPPHVQVELAPSLGHMTPVGHSVLPAQHNQQEMHCAVSRHVHVGATVAKQHHVIAVNNRQL